MDFIIDDFSISDHLAAVLHAGKKTPEFAVGQETIFWSSDILSSWLNKSGGPMLVAIDCHGSIVGFLLSTFQNGGVATIENILVTNANRRRRIATAMLDVFERRARDAAMMYIHAFSHASNEAVTRLLAEREYQDLGVAQWCSGNPRAMLSSEDCVSYRHEELEIRHIVPQDVDEAWMLGCDDIGLVGSIEYPFTRPANNGLFNAADTVHGAFLGTRLVGVATTSLHEPTSKATIESIAVMRGLSKLPVLECLVRAVIRAVAERGIMYLTAYPAAALPLLVNKLVDAGFVQQRPFRLHSKKLS